MSTAAVSEAPSPAAPGAENDEEPRPYQTEPDKYVKGQSCVALRFVGSKQDATDGEAFTPEYVHQIYDNESIALPPDSRPLKMEVLYTAGSLDLWLRCADDAKPQGEAAEDAFYALAGALPPPCSRYARARR